MTNLLLPIVNKVENVFCLLLLHLDCVNLFILPRILFVFQRWEFVSLNLSGGFFLKKKQTKKNKILSGNHI